MIVDIKLDYIDMAQYVNDSFKPSINHVDEDLVSWLQNNCRDYKFKPIKTILLNDGTKGRLISHFIEFKNKDDALRFKLTWR